MNVNGSGRFDYIWANEYCPWWTDRLPKVITGESSKRLGKRLTTPDYRHVAVSLGHEKVGEQFSRGYIEETTEVEEPEAEGDDRLEVLAGKGGDVGVDLYGVSLDVIKHLSSRPIDIFRPLRQKWHEFSGLASYGKKGKSEGRKQVAAAGASARCS